MIIESDHRAILNNPNELHIAQFDSNEGYSLGELPIVFLFMT